MKYIAAILFVLLLSSYAGSCVGGGGINVTIDGHVHTFSWR